MTIHAMLKLTNINELLLYRMKHFITCNATFSWMILIANVFNVMFLMKQQTILNNEVTNRELKQQCWCCFCFPCSPWPEHTNTTLGLVKLCLLWCISIYFHCSLGTWLIRDTRSRLKRYQYPPMKAQENWQLTNHRAGAWYFVHLYI